MRTANRGSRTVFTLPPPTRGEDGCHGVSLGGGSVLPGESVANWEFHLGSFGKVRGDKARRESELEMNPEKWTVNLGGMEKR